MYVHIYTYGERKIKQINKWRKILTVGDSE